MREKTRRAKNVGRPHDQLLYTRNPAVWRGSSRDETVEDERGRSYVLYHRLASIALRKEFSVRRKFIALPLYYDEIL